MHVTVDRATLQELANKPLGGIEDAGRCSKVWLPLGKLSPNAGVTRAMRKAMKAAQIDLEDAVEAAGGERGHMGRS